MANEQFQSFVETEKAKLAECLRGSGRLTEDLPDMPAISDAGSLKEQFYDSISRPCHAWDFDDGIDWAALKKELIAYSDEIWDEWMERKKAQDKADAFEMGRE